MNTKPRTSYRPALLRGLVAGLALALAFGPAGLLMGLVAIPLERLERRAQRANRRQALTLTLGAWLLATTWIGGAWLQRTYVAVSVHRRAVDPFLPGTRWDLPPPERRFDTSAAMLATWIEARRILHTAYSPHKYYTRPGLGPLFVTLAFVASLALALRAGQPLAAALLTLLFALVLAGWGGARGARLGVLQALQAGALFAGWVGALAAGDWLSSGSSASGGRRDPDRLLSPPGELPLPRRRAELARS